MLINEKHLAELNSSLQTINSRVELHNGSTLEQICSCNDYVSNFNIERVGEGKFFGYGICHKLNIVFVDPDRELNLTNIDTIEVTFGVDGEFIYPFPVFYISEVSRDETTNEISVVAYDALFQAANHKVRELDITPGYTIEEFADACASLLGMPMKIIGVDDDCFKTYYAAGANFDGTETIRQVLDDIAEATQTIYYMSGDWELTFKRLDQAGDSVLTIDKNKYIEFKSGQNCLLSGIEHTTELGDNAAAGLKTVASGEVVFLNDVSNKNYELATTVNSKNLIKYPYLESLPITREGITFSSNGDGGIAVSGTATGFAVFRLCDGSFLRDGQSYLLSEGILNDGVHLHVAYFNENNEVKYFSSSPMVWSDKYKFQQCYIQVKPGTVCNGEVIYPAINVGTGYGYAQFTPYVDISTLEVRSYGKNLISYPYKETTKTVNGITYKDNKDGSITINGKATADYISFIFGHSLPLKDGVTYDLTGCDGKLIIRYYNEAGAASWATGLITWRKEYILETVYVQVNTGETFNNVTWYPMIREANTSAEYEPYIGQTYTLDSSGVVAAAARFPYMTIATNNENAEVHVEYYRQQLNGATQYIRDNAFWENREDLQTLVDNALEVAYGLTINPFNCEWTGNYLLEIGDKITLIGEDNSEIITYIVDDSITFNGALDQFSKWEYSEDEAEDADTPITVSDTLFKTFAKVDKVEKQITLQVASEMGDKLTQLQMDTQSISASVKKVTEETNKLEEENKSLNNEITTVKTDLSTFKQTSTNALLEFQTKIETDGVTKIDTKTGFLFNDEGLTITKTDSKVSTNIDEDGMTVSDTLSGESLLVANSEGVQAKNLHATTYLKVGGNSRFENYEKDGEARTACFWID